MASIVTATWGEATVSPKPYHTYRVGPFSAAVEVRPGETEGEALERAQKIVNAHGARMVKAAREFWYREWRIEE